MNWTDEHGRPELFMNPDILNDPADWRVERPPAEEQGAESAVPASTEPSDPEPAD